jgi:glycosyltransferase involved in cell wall biosynthesis
VIAIPVLTLVPGVVGGSEIYVRELLSGLARVGTNDVRAVVPPQASDAADGLPHVVATDYRGPRLVAMARAAADLRFARLVADADVVHYPLTVPVPRARGRTIVTLHDLQHRDLPALFSRAERGYRLVAYDRAAKRADRVVVISEFVKERAVELLGIPADRIVVVPLGVDHSTLAPRSVAREPFVLYPAKPWRHKNHARLFSAFELLREARPELRLVLTGGGELPPLPEGVESRGHVPRADVIDLMQRASALVFPSLYEGFGLPPLEAMACGCPVACSNAASLPEVVGDAARLFDPNDAQAIAAAVADVLDDPAPWVERGLARAARFSWDETARRTDAVYAELLP